MAYRGYIKYASFDTEMHTVQSVEFDNVADATKWVSEYFTHLMLNWGSISENGLEIYGEVCNADDTFCDSYHLRCGL